MKQRAIETQHLAAAGEYTGDRNAEEHATGFIAAFFATLIGFALIWHIWWMVGAGLVLAYVGFVVVRLARRGRIRDPGERGSAASIGERRRAREQWLGAQRQCERGGMTATATITLPGAPATSMLEPSAPAMAKAAPPRSA